MVIGKNTTWRGGSNLGSLLPGGAGQISAAFRRDRYRPVPPINLYFFRSHTSAYRSQKSALCLISDLSRGAVDFRFVPLADISRFLARAWHTANKKARELAHKDEVNADLLAFHERSQPTAKL